MVFILNVGVVALKKVFNFVVREAGLVKVLFIIEPLNFIFNDGIGIVVAGKLLILAPNIPEISLIIFLVIVVFKPVFNVGFEVLVFFIFIPAVFVIDGVGYVVENGIGTLEVGREVDQPFVLHVKVVRVEIEVNFGNYVSFRIVLLIVLVSVLFVGVKI